MVTVWILLGADPEVKLWVQEVYWGAMAVTDDGGNRVGQRDPRLWWESEKVLANPVETSGPAAVHERCATLNRNSQALVFLFEVPHWPLCWGVCACLALQVGNPSQGDLPQLGLVPVPRSRTGLASFSLGFLMVGSSLGRDPFGLKTATFHGAHLGCGKPYASLFFLLNCLKTIL